MVLFSTTRSRRNRRFFLLKNKPPSPTSQPEKFYLYDTSTSSHTSITEEPIDLDCSMGSSIVNDINDIENLVIPSSSSSAKETNIEQTEPESASEESEASSAEALSVRFSTVHIREYDLCLGDNPSVGRGAPISLDWHYNENEITYPLDSCEDDEQEKEKEEQSIHQDESGESSSSTSQEQRSSIMHNTNVVSTSSGTVIGSIGRDHDLQHNRNMQEMKVSSLERLYLLKEMGYSRQEINDATDKVKKIKKQRIQTRQKVERMDNVASLFFCCSEKKKQHRRRSV